MTCVYLGQDTDRKHNKEAIHDCQIYGQCLQQNGDHILPSCDKCSKFLSLESENFPRLWQDPLKIYDRTRKESSGLRNLLAGRPAFVLGSGPSAKNLPLEELNKRGCFTLATNNAAGYRIRPQAFVADDPCLKFSHCIWLDPGIIKFIPKPKLGRSQRGKLVRKINGPPDEQAFVPLVCPYTGQTIYNQDCPNVWAYQRRDWLSIDDTFFLDEAASMGNYDAGVLRTGEPKTACILLVALRLLRYLGAKTVFLLGVDFNMDVARGESANYSFPQRRTEDACSSNNSQFTVANDWLCRLVEKGVFRRFGMDVYNCNEYSGLRAFPYIPFKGAIDYSTIGIEQIPDLTGWYEKYEPTNKS